MKRVLANRKGAKAVIVDGHSGFLFLNRDGNPKTAPNYDTMFRLLVKKYNKSHEEALPKVNDTAHTPAHVLHQLSQCGNEPESAAKIHLQFHNKIMNIGAAAVFTVFFKNGKRRVPLKRYEKKTHNYPALIRFCLRHYCLAQASISSLICG